jgi:hypothetical protein
MSKGRNCSIEGNKYEQSIHNLLLHTRLDNRQFHTQNENTLGGCSARNDIICNYISETDIGIEIKKFNTPDWMQCSIRFDYKSRRWEPVQNGKIPMNCRIIFKNLLQRVTLFDGDIPPFVDQDITHDEWTQIKRETDQWDDAYIDIPNIIIRDLYHNKGCSYIQLSNGFGLYHLGTDVCGFGVPEFLPDQQLRVRTKIHSRSNSRGFCSLSVTASCQPKNIKLFHKSPYSLDSVRSLPPRLIYRPPSR